MGISVNLTVRQKNRTHPQMEAPLLVGEFESRLSLFSGIKKSDIVQIIQISFGAGQSWGLLFALVGSFKYLWKFVT